MSEAMNHDIFGHGGGFCVRPEMSLLWWWVVPVLCGVFVGFLAGFRVGSCRCGRSRTEDNGPLRVLEGVLKLCEERWIDEKLRNKDHHQKKVVKYLKPEMLLKKLFHHGDKDRPSMALKTSLVGDGNNNITSSSKCMIDLFKSMAEYSVDTSHPYFFNQLFGATDPVGLAAELMALSVNTSVYTYETAPVFTLIEREVLSIVLNMVYGFNQNEQTAGDGLMMPGGSLSNLSALHVARQRVLGYWDKCSHHHHSDQHFATNTDTATHCYYFNQQAEEKKNDDGDSPPLLYHHVTNTGISTHCYHPDPYEEEKKHDIGDSPPPPPPLYEHLPTINTPPKLVAFVSSEAHYSFLKAASVTGIGKQNLISVPTTNNGAMDVNYLRLGLQRARARGQLPFFVGATAGSTVRGAFDQLEDIVRVCRDYDQTYNQHSTHPQPPPPPLWIHVDGAWGGPALFSHRPTIRNLLKGVEQVDSFTFNPHKMLGAPLQTSVFVSKHKNILKSSNSSHAKYLFDERKHGADYDLGDAAYTCSRRTDAVKIWAMLKYYGKEELGRQVDNKIISLQDFATRLRSHPSFLLACDPWPFNLNFFYLPRRIRQRIKRAGVVVQNNDNPVLPNDISDELAKVTVKLKLLMHEGGEMMIPYQPLSNQRADCFRIVLAGQKKLTHQDMDRIMALMERYGEDL